MKIAIFGGSFNPPHIGHLAVAKAVCGMVKPDRFYIIPAFIAPHKQLDSGSPSPEQRMEMCRLAFSSVNAEISDIEFRLGGKSYTYNTLRAFREEYPNDELYLVIGSDSLFDFEKWYRFEDIMKECTLCVVPREENLCEALSSCRERYIETYGAKVYILPSDPVVISSSELRHGADMDENTGAEVLEYIKKNHLYGK